MAKKNDQRDYTDFAELHDKSDGKVLAFIQKHGSLGLNPWKGDLIGKNHVSWDYAGRFIDDRGCLFFIPWESVPPVPNSKVPHIEETPDLIRREARKMHLIIQLWQIADECTDKIGRFDNDSFFKRRLEVNNLFVELESLWPDMPIMGLVFPPPGRTSLMMFDKNVGETIIKLPDFGFLFDDILLRVRFEIATDKDSLGKSPFMFNIKKGHLEIKESCLLAKLWYEMISDMVKGTAPPRICPYCNQLFMPDRPNQHYHPWCQAPASQHRYRMRAAKKDGRKLRTGPGRPPGTGPDKGKNNSKKEVQS